MGSDSTDVVSENVARGWRLAGEGDFKGAEAFARQALGLDQDSPDAHNLLGFVSAAVGDTGRALENYRHAMRLDPQFLDPMLNAIELLLYPINDTDAALRVADAALDACRNDQEVLEVRLLRIDALLQARRKEEAKREVSQLPQEPQPATLEFLIGRVRFETGDIDGALLHLERATVGEVDSDAFYYLGLARAEKKQFHGALLALLQCLEKDEEEGFSAWSLERDDFEQVVRQALLRLKKNQSNLLDGALVLVRELPPPELVAEGVDPRASVLIEFPTSENEHLRPTCVFVYQKNVERHAGSPENLLREIEGSLLRELKRHPRG